MREPSFERGAEKNEVSSDMRLDVYKAEPGLTTKMSGYMRQLRKAREDLGFKAPEVRGPQKELMMELRYRLAVIEGLLKNGKIEKERAKAELLAAENAIQDDEKVDFDEPYFDQTWDLIVAYNAGAEDQLEAADGEMLNRTYR